MLVWNANPQGDGIIVARLSTRDVQQGETALSQVHGAREVMNRCDRRARLIVVTTENKSAKAFEDRPDFRLIRDEIYAGRCAWVCFRDVDRLARKPLPRYSFFELLEETGTDLYLTELGRAVDWENDDLNLGFNGLIGDNERKRTYSRTHAPLVSRWLGEGRGWPGQLKFGFGRNEFTNFPEVDPEQWPFVKMVFETYATAQDGSGRGVRGVEEALAAAGCELSRETIRRILKDPIYVNGEFTTTRAGTRIAARPIPLHDPIPLDLFERVQQLRRLRKGTERRNPAGLFFLNALAYSSCGARIRGRTRGEGDARAAYEHYLAKGERTCDCPRMTIPARDLEAVVVREVSRLAEEPELLDAWAARALPDFAVAEPVLNESRKSDLERRIANLQRTKSEVLRSFVDGLGESATSSDPLAAYHELVAELDTQIVQLREQLARAETIETMRRTTRPAATEGLREVMRRLLTDEPPEEAELIAKRAAFLRAALSKVVVHLSDDGTVEIELFGHLVPRATLEAGPYGPLETGSDVLLGHLRDSRSGPTDTQVLPYGSVGQLGLPSIGQRSRAAPKLTPSPEGVPAWRSPRLRTAIRWDAGSRQGKFLHSDAVVARVVELRAEGVTHNQIATTLAEEGFTTPFGGRWSDQTVSNILKRTAGAEPLAG
jgi:DNA invertase Pin-like site-specific DNA recombinase